MTWTALPIRQNGQLSFATSRGCNDGAAPQEISCRSEHANTTISRSKAEKGPRSRSAEATATRDTPYARAGAAFPIVAVAASAGGLEAFTQLLRYLPTDTGVAFVLVKDLDPARESVLSAPLVRVTSLPVSEAANVQPNHIYVIPPRTSLSVTDGILRSRRRQQTRTPSESIGFFFESLTQDQRGHAIGVILSGTATGGALGLEEVRDEGRVTFALDETARYDSMPRSATAAGCVDFVLSPDDIGKELARIAKYPPRRGSQARSLSGEHRMRARF